MRVQRGTDFGLISTGTDFAGQAKPTFGLVKPIECQACIGVKCLIAKKAKRS
jgi:hypothetical protein